MASAHSRDPIRDAVICPARLDGQNVDSHNNQYYHYLNNKGKTIIDTNSSRRTLTELLQVV